MENKKQLIIIPPMSEALRKLHEVLEGITTDENVEITLVDDLKELSQFLGTTGQCLILVANAKKCATFLQENRFILAKHHCKTILLTPKEIPQKTLIKFTKIGLTESILESSPPKTFLYKVKLLLRSIKTNKPQEDLEKMVKSLDQKVQVENDLEFKEKNSTEENVVEIERQSKKERAEGETIDYGNPLKGKVKPTEESLDTHWKSDRKKDFNNSSEEPAESMALESEQDSIDMYYRGKSKKPNNETQEEDDFDKKMAELMALEEAEKKKGSFADVIDEGTMKQKRLDKKSDYIEEPIKKRDAVELDLQETKTPPRLKVALPDEEDEFDKKMAELMALEEAKKKNEGFTEELGGYLKGKVLTKPLEEIEDTNEDLSVYDNSDLEEKKAKSIELELEAAEKKKKKNNIEGTEEDNIHEGVVDQIEGNMIGDESTVEKIRTRMEGRSSYDENALDEEADADLLAKKKNAAEETSSDKSSELDLDSSNQDAEGKKRLALRGDEEEQTMRQKSIELDLAPGAKKPLVKDDENDSEEKRQKSLAPLPTAVEHERGALDKNSEEEKRDRSNESGQNAEKTSGNSVHNSTVDKIDTFYRGGEAGKKKEQNWDNLIDKNSSAELLPGKERRSDSSSIRAEKADLGEQTIDYRKMKEEFELMASGTSASDAAGSSGGSTQLKNDDDEGSFKVVEIDPKSLDFSINIINGIYQKEMKPKQIFAMLADELLSQYHCYPVFFTYKLSDKKFTEVYNAFIDIKDDRVSMEKKDFWNEFKKDTALFEHFQEKSMTTWRCSEIINNNEAWEDVELPSWAENELQTKKVELIFPYFDGLDRMGLAVVLLPDGLDPKTANGLLTVLELARTLFLDTIQRYQVQTIREDRETAVGDAPVVEPKNILSFFGGLFGKKKAG